MRLPLVRLSSLVADRPIVVPSGQPPPRSSLIVVKDGAAVRAYWNICQHVPVPLDSGGGTLPPGGELVCQTHGARYEARSGLCVQGPCKGRLLEAVPVALDPALDQVYALLDDG